MQNVMRKHTLLVKKFIRWLCSEDEPGTANLPLQMGICRIRLLYESTSSTTDLHNWPLLGVIRIWLTSNLDHRRCHRSVYDANMLVTQLTEARTWSERSCNRDLQWPTAHYVKQFNVETIASKCRRLCFPQRVGSIHPLSCRKLSVALELAEEFKGLVSLN